MRRRDVAVDAETERGYTAGSPYYQATATGLEGPFWPRLLGPAPMGYLSEPTDSGMTYGADASELLLSGFGLSSQAKGQGDNH